jgi:hypothetical protein
VASRENIPKKSVLHGQTFSSREDTVVDFFAALAAREPCLWRRYCALASASRKRGTFQPRVKTAFETWIRTYERIETREATKPEEGYRRIAILVRGR